MSREIACSIKMQAALMLAAVLFSTSPSVLRGEGASKDRPNVNELCANWRSWANQLSSLPPNKCVYEMSLDSYGPIALERSRIESYEALPDYEASQCELVPERESEFAFPRFGVTVRVARSRYQLVRDSKSEKWKIAGTEDTGGPIGRSGPFRVASRIPAGFEESKDEAEKFFKIESVKTTPDGLLVHFRVRNVLPEVYDQTSMLIDSFQVVFARDEDWLPVQIDRNVRDGNLQYVWRTTFEDFQQFAGLPVPRVIKDPMNSKEDFSKPLNWITIISLEEVPLEEVTKRCDLSYWQLANLDVGKSTLRWWVVGGTIALALAGWWFRSRYQPAR